MMTRFCALALSAALALPAFAHGPTPQTATKNIQVDAAPEVVWELVKDPATLADWHPGVGAITMEGEGQGARRVVELTDGGSVTDGIDNINDEKMDIRWRLAQENIEAFPVSFYTNNITVTPDGDGAGVSWHASFFRADTTNEPEERFSDEAAVAAMEKYIQDGLEGIKATVEAAPGS